MYESGQQLFQGIKSIAHPGYSHPGHSNDLMLIKLNKRIRETPYVRPINIASCCPSAGTSCLVSGWGTTSSPQALCPSPVFLHRSPPARPCGLSVPVTFPKALQCLNITGDSGGPVVCNGSLQGLVSWGDFPCAQPNRPGVYTNLCQFTKWIQDTIKSNS
ncbi:KLK5 [Cervus elaphus hippelaphus]|uniref:KLK5 n=1 Tax=Cervus elaphus hippelaphus TaxID=46360 RepID=A0A212DC98_CEREH|nr:KLK5 [Cervus elaphus hippelaphus]